MTNQFENKLVIVSEPGYGEEFRLLPGKTTIGSAPGNDIKIECQGVSGFHAEFNIEKNRYSISDFSSEKGTFVNDEKIAESKQVDAGDIIKLGSVQTVFIPRNAIFEKEKGRKVNYLDTLKIGASEHKKWVAAACVVLVFMCAIKMISAKSSTDKTIQKEPLSNENKNVNAIDSAQESHDKKNEQKNTAAKGVQENKVDSPNQIQNNDASAAAGDNINETKYNMKNHLPSIYFNVADKFSEYQLWSDALEHYQKVSEVNYEYPGLSVKIDKMNFELNNQKIYEQGRRIITKGSYQEGIAILRNVGRKSFYYTQAERAISDAKEKLKHSYKKK